MIFLSNAVIPRLQGDDYQACYFWLRACDIFYDHTRVTKVAYEHDEIKSFDDVVLFYDPPIGDRSGGKIHAEYFQVKFHATQSDVITCENLMDPKFINAESVSFLEKLRNAQTLSKEQGRRCLFYMVTNWIVSPNDVLSELISNNEGEIRLDKLFIGGPRSKMGKLRTAWCKHLGLQNTEELREVLRPLRIIAGYKVVGELQRELNRALLYAGLKPVENGSLINPYVSLIKTLLLNGRKEFTRDELLQICKEENLWIGQSAKTQISKVIGIRSFYRWAEKMENETEAMLCLLKYFDGRYVKADVSWDKDVIPELEQFLTGEICSGEKVDIHIDAHASIAFAAGYCLDPKSGVDVAPVQRNNGREVWRPNRMKNIDDYPGWKSDIIIRNNTALDMAVALSVRHDIVEEVEAYLTTAGLPVREIISCYPHAGSGAASIADGTHAYLLADKTVNLLKKQMLMKKNGRLHIFVAAPNAFCFFLGQLSRGLGRVTFYEYDFDNEKTYSPAISLPRKEK